MVELKVQTDNTECCIIQAAKKLTLRILRLQPDDLGGRICRAEEFQ